MIVLVHFMGRQYPVTVSSVEEAFSLVSKAGVEKYDSFKQIVEPVFITGNADGKMIPTSIDFTVKSIVEVHTEPDADYDLFVTIDKIQGTIGYGSSAKTFHTINILQDIESIEKEYAMIADYMSAHAPTPALANYYLGIGTGDIFKTLSNPSHVKILSSYWKEQFIQLVNMSLTKWDEFSTSVHKLKLRIIHRV